MSKNLNLDKKIDQKRFFFCEKSELIKNRFVCEKSEISQKIWTKNVAKNHYFL